MKLFKHSNNWWAADGDHAVRLDTFHLDSWLASPDPLADLSQRFCSSAPQPLPEQSPLAPTDSQEVWAAGVTYQRSKAARMEESDFSASAYDRVYDAPRPELFFKATPRRCAGPGQALLLRDDTRWIVPEPELALVISSTQKIVGFTIGNDLSCRDIEGENLLYLPQAKVWDRCCALGPCILTSDSADIRASTITVEIRRSDQIVFQGSTDISRIKRPFEELASWLFRNQTFPHGVILLTGTGIVPPDDFCLAPNDEIRMSIPQIGTLTNPVTRSSSPRTDTQTA